MFIYADESGTTGGSAPFVIAMIIARDGGSIRAAHAEMIKNYEKTFHRKFNYSELKFHSLRDEEKYYFLKEVAKLDGFASKFFLRW